MLRIALALALLASTPVEAHCYSRWYYPWPQQCRFLAPPSRAQKTTLVAKPAIALPGLAQADLDGGGADEPTRARLLLRAALEAANGQ
jgi:hypothetical protein